MLEDKMEIIDIDCEPSLSYYCNEFNLDVEKIKTISIPREYFFQDSPSQDGIYYELNNSEHESEILPLNLKLVKA